MKIYKIAICLFLYSLSIHAQPTYILHCGQLFDAEEGTVLNEMSIIVYQQEIRDVVPGYVDASSETEIIDLTSSLVLPGLIDLHVHLETLFDKDVYINKFRQETELLSLRAYAHGVKTLKAGFTTVRDLGGTGANSALRDAIDRGIVQGPRIYTCRKSLAITGGHADPTNGMKLALQGSPTYQDGVCDGAEECAKAVRWQVKQGADCIKITATGGVLSVAKDGDGPAFEMDELVAIVETATDRGVHVAAHAHGKEGMLRAVQAGVRTIEHGTFMDEEVMEEMIRRGTYYVPTITAGWSVAENAKIDGFFPEIVRPKAMRIGPQIQETFSKAYERGVRIAFGTDAGVFMHGQNAKEFELMVDSGMPMLEALQSATWIAAQVLEWEDKIGSIVRGKLADIVAVPTGVLTNPSLMMEIDFVMKNGEIIVE